jgi:hypothetical protein
MLSEQVCSTASFFLRIKESHSCNTLGSMNRVKLPRLHKFELYSFRFRTLYLSLTGFMDGVIISSSLSYKYKDKSINLFLSYSFTVATKSLENMRKISLDAAVTVKSDQLRLRWKYCPKVEPEEHTPK